MFHARTNNTCSNFSKSSLIFLLFNPNRAASHGTCTVEGACIRTAMLRNCSPVGALSHFLVFYFPTSHSERILPGSLNAPAFYSQARLDTTTVKQPEAVAKENTQSHAPISPPLVLCLLCTAKQTRSPGSNETSLLTLCSVTRDSRSFTDMLMVTTAVRL